MFRLTLPAILLTVAACGSTEPQGGSVVVAIETSGQDLDADGYTVSIDGAGTRSLPANGTVTLTGLTIGGHTLTLTGVAANCALQGPSEITVSVTDDVPGRADVAVVCSLANTLAYVQNDAVHEVAIEPAATPVPVATNFTGPAWSPDGSKLALVSTLRPGGVFLVDASGGTPSEVTSEVAETDVFGGVAWSPDSRTLVFDYRDESTANHRLYVLLKRVSVDGTGYDMFIPGQQVGSGALSEQADWAPDGSLVAFDDQGNVCLANPDGSGVHCLARGHFPHWSPDGTTLAYDGPFDGKLHTIRRDSTDLRDPTPDGPTYEFNPQWSPDGSQIAFVHLPTVNDPGVYMLMNADGSGRTVLAPTLVAAGEIAWSFDGIHLALTGRVGGETDSRIYLVKRDGTDLRPVTAGTACCMEWRP